MGDLWDVWDRRVRDTGRPTRVASGLTDAELVRLLAGETTGRTHERRLLCEELFGRLQRPAPQQAHGPALDVPPEAATWPRLGPEAGP